MWLFTIGLFWAAFRRESGSCLEGRVRCIARDVSGLDWSHHVSGSWQGRWKREGGLPDT